MQASDAIAFDRLIRDFHEAFRDPDPLTATRKRKYWESLIGCSFDRVAEGFQRCFDYGHYKGLPLPGEIRDNMPAVREDVPLLEDNFRPDSQAELSRKYRFTQWCIGSGNIPRNGAEWRSGYDRYCRSGIDAKVQKILDRPIPRNGRPSAMSEWYSEMAAIALPQGGGE